MIDKSFRVLGYLLGKNEDIFLKYIDNRMYAMMTRDVPMQDTPKEDNKFERLW
jgi:DUF2075 family protein